MSDVSIRKLTERECWRLMGWQDAQVDKVVAAGVSRSQMYRQAGNSIVVSVLEAIFRSLFEKE
jgi:DNA (cytosine-5)-methyltransferase 1